MDEWTQFDVAAVREAMPTDMAVLYSSWLDANPTKSTRLAGIVAEILARFRATVATVPDLVMDAAIDTIPTSGFRHALNLAIFTLGMEMGVEFAPEVSGPVNRADVWLRMVASGAVKPVGMAAVGTPSYVAREVGERAI